jgi:hypothetical protein
VPLRNRERNSEKTVKTCRKCGKTKEVALFPKARKMRDGLSSWCRACHVEAVRPWRAANPDRVEEYNARRRLYPKLAA